SGNLATINSDSSVWSTERPPSKAMDMDISVPILLRADQPQPNVTSYILFFLILFRYNMCQ
ncbi:hypothetical protein J6590_007315, partial [Homalodisca vitripennis]